MLPDHVVSSEISNVFADNNGSIRVDISSATINWLDNLYRRMEYPLLR